MPQREFWTERHAVSWEVKYECDPRTPEGDGSLTLIVRDQAGDPLEARMVSVPWQVTHEAVSDAMAFAWSSWLFGEPGAASASLRETMGRWRHYRRVHILKDV